MLLPILATAAEPGRIIVVDRSHPRAADDAAGTAEAPLATIGAAVVRAGVGDTVLIGPGIYRESVRLERGGEEGRPLRLVGTPGGRTVISAAEPLPGAGEAVDGHPRLRRFRPPAALLADWNPLALDQRARPFGAAAGGDAAANGADAIAGGGDDASDRTLAQLFADGEPLIDVVTRADVEVRPGTWWPEPGGASLLVHPPVGSDPAAVAWELSLRARCLWAAPGTSHVELRDLVFERAANHFPVFGRNGNGQQGMVATGGGTHWTIAGCVIRQARMIGLECGRLGGVDAPPRERGAPSPPVGHHRIVGNRIVGNGLCGIAGMGTIGVLIAGNEIEGNGWQGLRGAEAAGIKLHRCVEGRIEGNLVRGNHAYGIWLDLGYERCRITRNLALANEGAGIFVELGAGPCLVDANLSAHNEGEGIYLHDASGVAVVRNLVLGNGGWGVYARVVSDRGFRRAAEGEPRPTAEASDIAVSGNVILDNRMGSVCLPWPWERARDVRCDHNAYAEAARWQWHHRMAPVFAFDDCEGRIPHVGILAGLAEACAQLPEAERPLALDGALPQIGFAAWRACGHDRSGTLLQIARGTTVHTGRVALEITLRSPLPDTGTPAHPEVTLGLLGAPLPGDGRPGPLPDLVEGRNRVLLWPLPAATP